MGRWSELLNEWEVQLLVLLSFILQLFLFFTGSLRRRSRSRLLRGTIWIAYLGADMVAIYALGILSRDANAAMDNGDDDASSSSSSLSRLAHHPLAFLWAPFLLIHLGGQDTITAFSIEDNKLWLRHLLNLLVQVTLALYVFWKSSSWHSTLVLFPGILLFVSGIIKYGERISALMHGDLNRMAISSSKSTSNNNSNSSSSKPAADDLIMKICNDALRSAPGIRMLFASYTTAEVAADLKKIVQSDPSSPYRHNRHSALFRLMDVELGMMYSDLYTKSAVLRTKSGIVFRCISLACTVAALILFFFSSSFSDTTNTGGGRVDTAITYTLFIGGFVVDLCSLLTMLMASTWTWAWLWAQGHRTIACFSWCLLSWEFVSPPGCCLGPTSGRPLWSNTMGQYRFVCLDSDSKSWSPPPSTLSERVMGVIRKLVGSEREKKKLFWLNRLLETKYVVVDDSVTMCLVKEIDDIAAAAAGHQHSEQQQWQCLGQLLLKATQWPELTNDFVHLVSWLHACTEVLLCEAAEAAAAKGISIATGTAGAAASADVCRKLSRYMMYLVAGANPAAGGASSLLQVVSGNPETEFQRWDRCSNNNISCQRALLCDDHNPVVNNNGGSSSSRSRMAVSSTTTLWPCSEMWEETLEELKHMWARLLVYAAARSRPEAHAAALATGGELLTFVWLLLSHYGLGGVSSTSFQVGVDLVRGQPQHGSSGSGLKSGRTYYVFNNLPVQMVNCPQLHNKLTSTPTESQSHQLAHSGVDP